MGRPNLACDPEIIREFAANLCKRANSIITSYTAVFTCFAVAITVFMADERFETEYLSAAFKSAQQPVDARVDLAKL